jgi:3-hydroxyisobutyrate dehydrogenase-like beta-hydroxyacid dehydrogenase
MRVGMIGLGLLGGALAERLIGSGHEVIGFDLSAERRDELAARGGSPVPSAVEVARESDVLLFSLPDTGVVASVLEEIGPALRAGQLVVDTTTGDPSDSAALGAKLAQRGVVFVDATVAGSSVQARAGQAIILAGGTGAAFAACQELFAVIGSRAFHVGPWGAGAKMKLVVNLALGLNRAVLAEALSLAVGLELDERRALEILKASPAYSTVMDIKGEKMIAREYSPQARLSQHLKDVRLILAAAARTATDLPLSSLHQQLLERAETAGLGQLDNSAIREVFGPPAGPE